MVRNKPSSEELRGKLNVGHFGSDPGPLSPSDPIGSTPMRLSIDEIDTYDHNPRRSRNPHYDEIKESIRAQGMRQPLVVTRRPGGERYMLRFGGNTRLMILRELLAETGDPSFQAADCQFLPWTDEADVLVGHLIENETRGELLFIEKARAVHEAVQLIQAEQSTALRQRQLVEVLRGRGYQIHQSLISFYDYALNNLADSMPLAFAGGIGRPQVHRLRQLDGAAEKLWKQRQIGPADNYRAVFSIALAGSDERDWSFDRARRLIERAIANQARIDVRLVTLELDAELDEAANSEVFEALAPSASAEPETEATPASATAVVADDQASPTPSPPPLRIPTWDRSMIAPIQKVSTSRPPGAVPVSATPPTARPTAAAATAMPPPKARTTGILDEEPAASSPFVANPLAPSATVPLTTPALAVAIAEPEPPVDLSDPDAVLLQRMKLIGRLRECGQIYARHAALESCIRTERSPWITMGYVVCEFPDAEHCARAAADERQRQVLAWCWWTLALCSDLFLLNEHLANRFRSPVEAEKLRIQLYGGGSRFVAAWRDLNTVATAIRQSVGNAELFGYSDYIDAASPELWAADLALRNAHRELRAFGAKTGIDVVGDPIDPNL
jgi:ParB family protein of integrating conjugative element (PFGI_1 class)